MLKILLIGFIWPEPTSSAAGWRMLQLIQLFLKEHEVHFASAASKSAHSHDLSAMGVEEHPILLNDDTFDTFIRDLAPDVVVFDRFMVEEQYAGRVIANCPQALRILDTEDLHFVRHARQEAYKKGTAISYKNEIAKREIPAILRSDVALIISEAEMALLEKEFSMETERLLYYPFQEDKLTADFQQNSPSFDGRKHFVFIGNFIHEPNWRTVEVLKRNIWPLLRKQLPDAELHIYGAYATEKVLQLHKPAEKFFIKGRAEDARACLANYKVMLAPIPFGAGQKGKFVDSMYAGTPTVSTSVGVEGMAKGEQWNGFVCNDYTDFVTKAVELYANQSLWERCRDTGFALFNAQFAATTPREQLLKWVVDRQLDLSEFRARNFWGSLLQQQQYYANKYMSLWIAAKNKEN
ncbi:glycosyltransferase [Sphingobacterium sp. Mn56C]|uniref:glycosyltransferase n=1 Tax=Sphingobacterium sp. Mn56C TaxID=3395261 RepID=UPI003BEB22D8